MKLKIFYQDLVLYLGILIFTVSIYIRVSIQNHYDVDVNDENITCDKYTII